MTPCDCEVTHEGGYGNDGTHGRYSIEYCPLHRAAPRMFAALEAAAARINGEWDHPELVKIGPLTTDTEADVQHIIRPAMLAAKGEAP